MSYPPNRTLAAAKAAKEAAKARKALPPAGCNCRNHMGTAKVKYPSRETALEAILRDYLCAGQGYSVYECPTTNRFHITSAT